MRRGGELKRNRAKEFMESIQGGSTPGGPANWWGNRKVSRVIKKERQKKWERGGSWNMENKIRLRHGGQKTLVKTRKGNGPGQSKEKGVLRKKWAVGRNGEAAKGGMGTK